MRADLRATERSTVAVGDRINLPGKETPMKINSHLAGVLAVCTILLHAAPAIAADGPIVITQAKALAGNVTPGDTPGFPVTLSRAGSYILGSNLQASAGKAGITIA